MLLALFVPTASAAFIQCQTLPVTLGAAPITLTCGAITVPTGSWLSGVDLELIDDAQGPAAAGATVTWTWNTFVIPGATQTGSQVNMETAPDFATFSGCVAQAGSIVATCPSILGTYAEHVLAGNSFGPVTVNVAALGGNGGLDVAGSASARLFIQYDYSSNAPEPATMGLMGGALLGLALFGKKLSRR
jgi:hypothetical protein